MSHTLRNFEPGAQWSAEDGKLTERAMGFLRDLFGYIGANLGTTPGRNHWWRWSHDDDVSERRRNVCSPRISGRSRPDCSSRDNGY